MLPVRLKITSVQRDFSHGWLVAVSEVGNGSNIGLRGRSAKQYHGRCKTKTAAIGAHTTTALIMAVDRREEVNMRISDDTFTWTLLQEGGLLR